MSNRKIALVGFRLNKGGSERVMANLSNFFSKKGIDVHIIIFHDDLGYSYSGSVFNLGKLKSDSNTIFNKIKRFYYFNNYIKKHQFDFIIDFRFRINLIQEIFIKKYIYNKKIIYTVHSSKIDSYLPNNFFLARLIYANSYKIVSITNAMQQIIEEKYQLKNMKTIYNSINIPQIINSSKKEVLLDYEYVISVGQYVNNVKQYDKLILAYSKSILPKKKIKLVLLGEGDKKEELIQVAKLNGVEKMVRFLGFKTNPYKYIRQSKFYLMTSLYEGLPMTLLEALACGTPIISFDCPTGPKEIIKHKKNGLLVENQKINEFIEAINMMFTNKDLYNICKKNAKQSVEQFSIDVIGQQWLELMNYN